MNAEIIAVGSELLLGQIVNSNAQFLSSRLAELGINVYYHTVVGDNPKRLNDVIQIAQKRSNLIIFTGGLGPTKDDLTKETIAKLLGKKLVIDKNALQSIEEYFQKTGRTMTENNRKQALVLEDSQLLPNENGMAPGMGITINGITYLLFPGPPKEMQPMFMNFGRTYLQKKLDIKEKIISRVLRFFGIGESQLETELIDLIDEQTNPTIAPLAGDGEVTLRLTAKHQSEEIATKLLDQIEQQILKRVGHFLYGYNDTSLVEEVMKKLIGKKHTIACAESLTGGLFATEITNISGASRIFLGGVTCYSNDVKEKILSVDRDILDQAGAVSHECALVLAENVRKLLDAKIGISFTGVAGPNTTEGKPVGTVFIGISVDGGNSRVYSYQLAGSRQSIRQRAVKHGFSNIHKLLNEMDS